MHFRSLTHRERAVPRAGVRPLKAHPKTRTVCDMPRAAVIRV